MIFCKQCIQMRRTSPVLGMFEFFTHFLPARALRERRGSAKCVAVCLYIASVCALLSGCVGGSVDIALKADGTGSMTLEYRMAAGLDQLGTLDGNKSWSTVPAGEADLRRSAARIEGMRLISFSSKTDEKSALVIYTAKFGFDNFPTLLTFLDGTGSHLIFAQDGGKNRLTCILDKGENRAIDPDLLALLESVSVGGAYDFSLTLRLPSGEGTTAVFDGNGTPLDIPGASLSEGKTLSFRVPIARLLSITEGVTLEMVW